MCNRKWNLGAHVLFNSQNILPYSSWLNQFATGESVLVVLKTKIWCFFSSVPYWKTNYRDTLIPRPSHSPVFIVNSHRFCILQVIKNWTLAGADPEIEEGGGIHIELGLVQRMYSTQHSRRVWGHAPPGKFWNVDHLSVLLRPSETTVTTQTLWQLECSSLVGTPGRG